MLTFAWGEVYPKRLNLPPTGGVGVGETEGEGVGVRLIEGVGVGVVLKVGVGVSTVPTTHAETVVSAGVIE